MQYVGTDWAYRRASWCALSESGAIAGEGVVPADEDGLEFFWDHAEALEAVGRSPQDAPLISRDAPVATLLLRAICSTKLADPEGAQRRNNSEVMSLQHGDAVLRQVRQQRETWDADAGEPVRSALGLRAR